MLAELRLKQFRSYPEDSFEFDSGVNIIVGPNASGKTNLLEAILMIARGSSYRVKDNELVQFGADWARLEARFNNGSDRIVKLNREPTFTKQFLLDGKPFSRLTLQHRLPAVLFEPEHLRLFSGGPDRRRSYLDDLLEQTRTSYGTLRRHYARTLAQRNSLLKTVPHDSSAQLFPWNVRLAHLGGQIVRARTELIQDFETKLPSLYCELAHSDSRVSLGYTFLGSIETYETTLLRKLESSIELDRLRGFTGTGPHRDDLLVTLNGRPASEVASRGEVRTMVLAMKIIELELLKVTRNKTPLLLLDDVFSELDGARRHALTTYLNAYQTFISTTDADLIARQFTATAHVIPLPNQ